MRLGNIFTTHHLLGGTFATYLMRSPSTISVLLVTIETLGHMHLQRLSSDKD